MSQRPIRPTEPRADFSIGWFVLAVVMALVAYAPTYRAGFIWNDVDYVTSPALRSWEGLGRIWTDVGATEQYYPLLHSLFWLQHQLWGDAAPVYHAANLAIHLAAAGLFGLVLVRLRVRGAWLAAAIFALHPVCVESVAWISEQKNTLSSFFFLAAAWFYLRYLERPRWSGYIAATLLFLAALLSKSLTAVLPPALLVALWWRDGKLEWRREVWPLLPWFLLGAVVGLFTAWVEKTYLGAVGGDFELTGPQRMLLAGRIPWFYLGKLFWPANMVFIYPRWLLDPSAWWQWLFPLAAIAGVGLAWQRRWRGTFAAALIFGGMLFPVIGFISLYGFLFSFVADHWQYLPCLGAIAWVGGAASALRESVRADNRLWNGMVAGLLVALSVVSWRLAQPYRDLRSFYEEILRKNPAAWMAQNNLGVQKLNAGEGQAAMAHYREALRLRPTYFEAENNLGQALDVAGETREAAEHYRRAVEINPTYAGAYLNLANAHFTLGRFAEAERAYRQALVLQPTAQANYNLGVLLNQTRRERQALVFYRRALALQPENAEARFNLASLLQQMGELSQAAAEFQELLRQQSTPGAHNNLGSVLLALNRVEEAEQQFRAALALDPNLGPAHANLAMTLRRLGRSTEALPHLEKARALMQRTSP